ncbi:MAG: adenylate/guanylate cyclase domain-containing protein [Xanthobacteraceae bacterium]
MAESQSRRLAAILAADIAGYSALMGADEARTVRDLKGHQAVVLPMIGQFGGRIIDTAGDGVLAEFASVVSAVKCALALQKTMAERNAAIEPDRRMQFRIGVNVGDVIYDKARIYGDGVNVAARLEGIATPGSICLSEDAYRQVRGKLDIPIADAGEQRLKNISNSVRVYHIEPSAVSAAADAVSPPAERRWRWSVQATAGAMITLAVILQQRSHGSHCYATDPKYRRQSRRQSRSPSVRCRSSPCCPSPIKPATTARIISRTA